MSTDNDDLLRDALRDDAGSGATPGDAWGAVRARATAIRRRRQLAQRVTAAVATLGVAAGVVIVMGALESDVPTIATPPASNDQIVAVQGPNNGGDRLVVLSADDGRVIRTLAEDIGITFGGISAAPDGQTVYFARRRTALPCDRVEIAKVPSAGGEAEVVGAGMSPLVSPDGRTLAYVRSPADDPCGPLSEIVRLSLVSGEEEVLMVNEVRDGAASPRAPVSWSPDGSSWLVANCCDDEWWSGASVEPVGNPGGARPLQLPVPADGATFLPDGRVLVALEDIAPGGAQLHKLVVFESVPGPPANNPPSADDFWIKPVETIFESRQNGVLHITANSSGEILMHFGGNLVQRWRPGQAEPTTIAEDIREVTWLPRSVEPTPDSTTTTTTTPSLSVAAPNNLVVATSDRKLQVIDAQGNVQRVIQEGVDLPYQHVQIAPDGVTLWYDQFRDACANAGGGPVLEHAVSSVRVDQDPGQFFHWAGAFVALSPDGTKLAYRLGACDVSGRLVVRDLATRDERSFMLAQPADGGPAAEIVGPVGWDADNQHLMLRVNREPTTEFWYVDTDGVGDLLSGPAFGPKGEQGAEIGPTSFAPLGTTGKWSAVHGNGEGQFSLVEFDLASSSVVRDLVDVPAPGEAVVVGVDPSGRHVLILVGARGRPIEPTLTLQFDLFGWSEGDTSLTLVAEGVVAADW